MLNYKQIKYSLMHRDVVRLLAKKYSDDEKFLEQVKYHDMDKILLYMQESFVLAHSKHLVSVSHHLESNIKKAKDDYRETIIDWDSARYTKPDKLLNAYQTLKKFYPEYYEEMLPILKELDLDHEVVLIDKKIQEEVLNKNYDEFTILDEIIEYVIFAINNKNLYYDIYQVLSNAYAGMTHEEKIYFRKK